MFNPNFQLLTDSYKVSHWKQLRPGTTRIYSYLESRGGMFDETVFFGLQPILQHLQQGGQFSSSIRHARRVWKAHFHNPTIYNEAAWAEILKLHYLPVSIKAVPEGTVVPTHNVLLTIENTDPRFPWLANWLETLLMQVWYPTTVATLSREIKKMIAKYLDDTVGDRAGLEFMLHDFGFRGVSSVESAAIGGAAHLLNFYGTDTAVALQFLENYYGANILDAEAPGYSVPAAEHSTIISWGKAREAEAYENMLNQFPDGIVAVVSDSYDIYNACTNIWGTTLKPRVMDRNGTVVIRPDSGRPSEVVARCLHLLAQKFGTSVTPKGFKVLDPHVRLIQGDGVDYDSIREILATMKDYKFAANNIAFGMGGALLQKLNRDTQRMALKCSETVCNGETIQVSKQPITDMGKASKAGHLALIKDANGKLITVPGPHESDLLQEVFRNGKLLQPTTLEQVRKRAQI